jgi:hypothetical protein
VRQRDRTGWRSWWKHRFCSNVCKGRFIEKRGILDNWLRQFLNLRVGWPIEHSPFKDEFKFVSYRIVLETATMPLLIVPGYTQVNTRIKSSTPYDS